MKRIILSLLIIGTLASCEQGANNETVNENIYKKHRDHNLKFDGPGEGQSESARDAQVQTAPFDFGLSAVLGVGALAALRKGRKRKQGGGKEALQPDNK